MRVSKLLASLVCLFVLSNVLLSMSRWKEQREINDDVCYLRQAHLFKNFGLRGLDTDIAGDKDPYFRNLVRERGHPEWATPEISTCHVKMASGKQVIQYPPGTGFLLALLPEGAQLVPLYMITTFLLFCMALLAIRLATSGWTLAAATILGCEAIYLMINPAKNSFSVAPTMVLCAVLGFLTALSFHEKNELKRMAIGTGAGLLLGLSVNLRITNVLLSAGYFMVLMIPLVFKRQNNVLVSAGLFGAACLAGMAPTLVANAINAGSPLSTTYGSADTAGPVLRLGVIRAYLTDTPAFLILAALVWMAFSLVLRPGESTYKIVFVTTMNLIVSLAFFLTHPIHNGYYLLPVAMLSLWTLLFDSVMNPSGSSLIPARVRMQ